MSDACFNKVISLVKEMTPEDNQLPETLYDSKQMMKGLGLPYLKIDACPKNCMLFYRENAQLMYYTVCGQCRYKEETMNRDKKKTNTKKSPSVSTYNRSVKASIYVNKDN